MTSYDIKLGVNIDHVATLREARGTPYPEPVEAALIAERSGADSITVHLREDRRHIQDRDIEILADTLQTRMNLEMAMTGEMLEIATAIKPSDCCLVPERREELTTEGGLDVAGQVSQVRDSIRLLQESGIRVSLFIDPDPQQIDAAVEAGADVVELHTGTFADATDERTCAAECDRLRIGARHAEKANLIVHGGHGLNYHNVSQVASIEEMRELNIGHAIVARAVIDGLANAVSSMRRLILEARAR